MAKESDEEAVKRMLEENEREAIERAAAAAQELIRREQAEKDRKRGS